MKKLVTVAVSDTHNSHRELIVPQGDILIHSGDATDDGTESELADFFDWLGSLPHRDKVFVPGNHDSLFATDIAKAMSLVPSGINVLIGEEAVLDGSGLVVFGAPWVPLNQSLSGTNAAAFAIGLAAREAAWGRLQTYVDILVSHMPPLSAAGAAGDDLVDLAIFRSSPRLAVCGHVHRARGRYDVENSDGGLTFVINAASMDEVFQPRPPFVFEMKIG
jgi:Icc-related predicted phosphoesterase